MPRYSMMSRNVRLSVFQDDKSRRLCFAIPCVILCSAAASGACTAPGRAAWPRPAVWLRGREDAAVMAGSAERNIWMAAPGCLGAALPRLGPRPCHGPAPAGLARRRGSTRAGTRAGWLALVLVWPGRPPSPAPPPTAHSCSFSTRCSAPFHHCMTGP